MMMQLLAPVGSSHYTYGSHTETKNSVAKLGKTDSFMSPWVSSNSSTPGSGRMFVHVLAASCKDQGFGNILQDGNISALQAFVDDLPCASIFNIISKPPQQSSQRSA